MLWIIDVEYHGGATETLEYGSEIEFKAAWKAIDPSKVKSISHRKDFTRDVPTQ